MIVSSLDDYIARQPSVVTKKRPVLPVVLQRMQVAESLERTLLRVGLGRRSREVDVAAELAQLANATDGTGAA